MKRNILLVAFLLIAAASFAQNRIHRFNFSAGGHIQHYNGNLGNSLLKFRTVCFSGVTTNLGFYLNPALDLNLHYVIGHFGYCPTLEEQQRELPVDLECPGESCQYFAGMGNLRSQMISSNLNLRFKFANGFMLPEESRFVPYLYTGIGMNLLTDVMLKDCLNPGLHLTINGGTGLQFNITKRINIAYNMDMACFMTKKVYKTRSTGPDGKNTSTDPLVLEMEKRKDLGMRNSILIGFNF